MWRAFPIYRVTTSARYGIAKYRRSEEVTRTRLPNLLPASVDHTKAWVLKVATMDVLAIPIDPDPTPNNVWTLLQRRPDGF